MFALPKKNSKSDSTFSTYVTVYDLCPRPARSWARPGRPRHCTYNYSRTWPKLRVLIQAPSIVVSRGIRS